MRQRPTTQSDRWQARVLLREYDNLARDIRTLLTGQYTLGMIGVILPLGVLTAALQFDRKEVVLALPGAVALVACGIGVQQVMMAYRGEHLSVVEDSINRVCGAHRSPLLTWFTCRSDVHLTRSKNPTTPWLGLILLTVLLIYLGGVAAGTYIAFDLLSGVPEPFETFQAEWWRRVGASLFAAVHVVLAAVVGRIFWIQGELVKSAYRTLEGRSPHGKRGHKGDDHHQQQK